MQSFIGSFCYKRRWGNVWNLNRVWGSDGSDILALTSRFCWLSVVIMQKMFICAGNTFSKVARSDDISCKPLTLKYVRTKKKKVFCTLLTKLWVDWRAKIFLRAHSKTSSIIDKQGLKPKILHHTVIILSQDALAIGKLNTYLIHRNTLLNEPWDSVPMVPPTWAGCQNHSWDKWMRGAAEVIY